MTSFSAPRQKEPRGCHVQDVITKLVRSLFCDRCREQSSSPLSSLSSSTTGHLRGEAKFRVPGHVRSSICCVRANEKYLPACFLSSDISSQVRAIFRNSAGDAFPRCPPCGQQTPFRNLPKRVTGYSPWLYCVFDFKWPSSTSAGSYINFQT